MMRFALALIAMLLSTAAHAGEDLGTMGDGVINGVNEICDDGDAAGGDGCSATGQIESGWSCTGEPSLCGDTVIFVGSGGDTYNCDGSGDHVPINDALAACAADGDCRGVRLRAGLACVLGHLSSNAISLPDGVALEGETGGSKPTITRAATNGDCAYTMFLGDASPDSITLRNLAIDVNYSAEGGEGSGECFLGMELGSASDIIIHDVDWADIGSDAINMNPVAGFHAWANTFTSIRHEPFYILEGSSNVRIHDNPDVSSNGNSCARLVEVTNGKVYRNICHDPAGACFQIQGYGDGIEIFDNECHDPGNQGIWAFAYTTSNQALLDIHIHNNLFERASGSSTTDTGITSNGYAALIENNTIAGGGWENGIDDVHLYTTDSSCSSCPVTVRNNIIAGVNGFAISDRANSINVFTSTYNLFNDNDSGNHSNVTSGTGDQTGDPLFASSTDFHVQSQNGRWNGSAFVNDGSNSPAIDAGDPSSAYANEVEPNGDRINVGRYGNTAEASRSPPVTQTLFPDSVF